MPPKLASGGFENQVFGCQSQFMHCPAFAKRARPLAVTKLGFSSGLAYLCTLLIYPILCTLLIYPILCTLFIYP